MKKAIILTADKFEDMELFFPWFRLMEEGWHVDIAAPKVVEISGENGYTLTPDLAIDNVDPEKYDLLIIPGGSPDGAPSVVRKIEKAREITKAFFAKKKTGCVYLPWTMDTRRCRCCERQTPNFLLV